MKGLMKGAAIAAVTLALGTGAAQAQIAQFGVGGGVSIPTGDALDGISTGFHGTALVRLKPPALPVSFQIDGSYHRFGVDESGGIPVEDSNLRILSVTGNIVWTLPSAPATPVKPYLIGGLGLYSSKVTDLDSQSDFGVNVGAGFDLGAKLFAEARINRVFGDGADATFIPITVGLRF